MIQPTVRDPLAFDALLSSSWALFRRNWIVALPLLIALGLILALLVVVFALGLGAAILSGVRATDGGNSPAFVIIVIVFYLVFAVGAITLNLWGYTATFGMADAAWERGTATFADGNAAFRSRTGALIVALIGMTGLAILALILAIPTLFIALLAFPLFTMYVFPAVVAGRRGGFEAIGDSIRLVRRFFLPSLIACVVLFGISYGISFIAAIPVVPLELAMMPGPGETQPHMPPIPLLVFGLLGYVVAIILSLAYTGFYAIAIVGLYRSLVAQPQPSAAPPAAPPPFTSPPAAA
ncbi:MAG TPA: hypothetical protein VHT05_07155 [Candidatus Elarobacter sp.]|nr:hypothetical protein [Candidatus Elarobacter sp.]